MQKLQKKLALLETDIGVHREIVDSLSSRAQSFVTAGHFDGQSIAERQALVAARYEGLREPVSGQKARLAASLKLQQFFRDVEDVEAWIKEREPVASSTNTGEEGG